MRSLLLAVATVLIAGCAHWSPRWPHFADGGCPPEEGVEIAGTVWFVEDEPLLQLRGGQGYLALPDSFKAWPNGARIGTGVCVTLDYFRELEGIDGFPLYAASPIDVRMKP